MNSRAGKCAVARCSLITANTATATATNAAFSDFSYLTSLRKRANITTITRSLINQILIRHKKARLFDENPRFLCRERHVFLLNAAVISLISLIFLI